MAAFMGGPNDPNGPNERFDPPKTPRMVVMINKDEGNVQPDTEDNVAEQTDGIFRNFVHQMYDLERGSAEAADNTPHLPEITAFPDPPLAPAAMVGRRLALIGDEINLRHASEFNRMIQCLNPSSDNAYEAFAGVARKMFKDGKINWGRIITLLCFGYRLAVSVLQRGIRGLFSDIVSFVVRFVVTERIAQWIAEQGGWTAALGLVTETLGWNTIGAIFGVAAVSVMAAIYLSKK